MLRRLRRGRGGEEECISDSNSQSVSGSGSVEGDLVAHGLARPLGPGEPGLDVGGHQHRRRLAHVPQPVVVLGPARGALRQVQVARLPARLGGAQVQQVSHLLGGQPNLEEVCT